jgi:propanediol dehydratase large subunit
MITGGRITAVDGRRERDGAAEGFATNIRVKEVSSDKNKLTVTYACTINYEPKLASITVEGEIFADDKDAKKIVEDWKAKGRLSESVEEEVIKALNYAVTATATVVSYAIGISAPINVPNFKRVESQNKPEKAG